MSRRSRLVFLAFSFCCGGRASALDAFACVRDLIPITGPASFQIRRTDVEKPFMIDSKFMAFPQVKAGRVTGFFLYASGHAWYYDTINTGQGRPKQISELDANDPPTLYQMVAQPLGLETVTLYYMPGFGATPTTTEAPMALGASLLPVVGGMVSRKGDPLHAIYVNPDDSNELQIKRWVASKAGRSTASSGPDVGYTRHLAKLSAQQTKTEDETWRPLLIELAARKTWVKNHNLNEENFRQLSRLMEGACRDD